MIAMKQAEDPSYAGWYNVGPDTEDCVTTGKLCDLFMSSYGEGLRWETPAQPSGPHEAGLLKLDNGKLKKTFGWKPVWHMDRTVRAITDWTKAWVQSNETANEELIRQIHEFTLTGSI
jgi:CDP-glucose 4,6-dehydratase